MHVAAYQAALPSPNFASTIALIREQVVACEESGISILCCPEAILGGLADYTTSPIDIAIKTEALDRVLAPLKSETVTTLIGFTEIDSTDHLFNSVAIFERGRVTGLYRKLHPAINRSVYSAGTDTPVFTVNGLAFGIIICRDSVFAEPARTMVAKGATTLFIPTNNGLPRDRFGAEVALAARECDIALATEHAVYTIRSDVVGEFNGLKSYGSSGVVAPNGQVLSEPPPYATGLLIAAIVTAQPLGSR